MPAFRSLRWRPRHLASFSSVLFLELVMFFGAGVALPSLRAQGSFPNDPVIPKERPAIPAAEESDDPAPDDKQPDSKAGAGEEAKPETAKAKTDGGVQTKAFTIEQGENLTQIAAKAYGRPGYWRILKLYNGVDPNRLIVGEVIEAPDWMSLMRHEGVVPLFDDVINKLMRARALFMEAEGAAGDADAEETGEAPARETEGEGGEEGDIKKRFLESRQLILECKEGLADRREGVQGVPKSTIQQLQTAAALIEKIASRDSDTAKERSDFHERIGNALTYMILWAREDFK